MKNYPVLRSLIVAFLGSQLWACADSASTHHLGLRNEPGIMGGSVVDVERPGNDLRSLVMLDMVKTRRVSLGSKVQEKKLGMKCTGTLLTSRVILTAAHCVEGLNGERKETRNPYTLESRPKAGDAADVWVTFAANREKRHLAAQVLIHPAYVKKIRVADGMYHQRNENDVALVILKQNAPPETKTAALFSGVVADKASVAVRSFGYGVTRAPYGAADTSTHGILRKVDISGTLNASLGVLVFDQRKGKGLCVGDSGGPDFVYIDNKAYVIGVHANVASAKVAMSKDPQAENPYSMIDKELCANIAHSIYIPAQAQWIAKTLNSLSK